MRSMFRQEKRRERGEGVPIGQLTANRPAFHQASS